MLYRKHSKLQIFTIIGCTILPLSGTQGLKYIFEHKYLQDKLVPPQYNSKDDCLKIYLSKPCKLKLSFPDGQIRVNFTCPQVKGLVQDKWRKCILSHGFPIVCKFTLSILSSSLPDKVVPSLQLYTAQILFYIKLKQQNSVQSNSILSSS